MLTPVTDLSENAVGFTASDHLTAEDYETVLIPAVEALLEDHEQVNILMVFDENFKGIDTGAMWDDIKFGFGHWRQWHKVAVVTDLTWLKNTMRALSFLFPAQTECYLPDQVDLAKRWVSEP